LKPAAVSAAARFGVWNLIGSPTNILGASSHAGAPSSSPPPPLEDLCCHNPRYLGLDKPFDGSGHETNGLVACTAATIGMHEKPLMKPLLSLLSGAGLALALLLTSGPTATAAAPLRVYSHLLAPREHPDDARRAVQPPDWRTFKNRTQFTALRGFGVEQDRIVGFREELEKYTRTHELGDVVWPSYPVLFATNLAEFATELKARDLYLFDIWGYVPGSGPGGYWQQFQPPGSAFATLESVLGDRWLGTDIGEQDGRYIGGYAAQMTPASGSRWEQYFQFQRHFERMGDDLGHRHATLVSLNFGHYFLKEGTYTLIGAETAQALPNSQVYYAFIRGAGKQYGVPWFGNASIFNRWGYKTYGSAGRSEGYDHGPTKGTSLSLMKRLLYSHILYNSVAVGFENGWFEGDRLSPIGRIQQSAQRWVKAHGQPGVQHTPVGLLLDFESGWSFPRHLYTDKLYRAWGNLPYEPQDYFIDGILHLLYPGYADASYFHDETGFLTATPYGDIADCLLSDAPLWLLERYPVLIWAGTRQNAELRHKLEAYVRQGGRLLAIPPDQQVAQAPIGTPRGDIDQPLASPFPLTAAARDALDTVLRAQRLFEVDPRLALITCRQGSGRYTLGILNNTWRELPLTIRSFCGDLLEVRELPLDCSEMSAVGYLPETVSPQALGRNTTNAIAGGEVRIFAVRVAETGVEAMPHQHPPPRVQGQFLTLRQSGSIKESILARPTFFEHWDGVVVSWRYLAERESAALRREAAWIRRQGLRVAVDLAPGLNLYPDLRLIDNLSADYAASLSTLSNVVEKMSILGAKDLLVSLHRHPENNFTAEQTEAGFEATLRQLAAAAAPAGIVLHLRQTFGKPPWSLVEAARFVERVGAANLRLAPSTALLADAQIEPAAAARVLGARGGFWLAAAPRRDLAGRLWDVHAPVHRAAPADQEALRAYARQAPQLPVILDAILEDADAEYLEATAVKCRAGAPGRLLGLGDPPRRPPRVLSVSDAAGAGAPGGTAARARSDTAP